MIHGCGDDSGAVALVCPACDEPLGSGDTRCRSCGEAGAPDPFVGRLLGERWRIERRLGSGAMGSVYRVVHARLGKAFALKLLRRHQATAPRFAERFEREARLLSRLDHPNCVGAVDFGFANTGGPYLVMELVEGPTLAERMDGPCPLAEALEIVRQLLLGLGHAHDRGVVHRDIKPQNVMLVAGSDGALTVKIVDFGIARREGAEAEPHLTRTGTIVGTPQYMAPEQATASAVDARADLYAVGAILWTLLTGKDLFPQSDVMVLLIAKVSQSAPPLPRAFPEALSRIVARALERRPADRFQTAGELLGALDALRSEAPRPRRRGAWIGALVVIVAVAFTGVDSKAPAPSPRVSLPVRVVTARRPPEPASAVARAGPAPLPASPPPELPPDRLDGVRTLLAHGLCDKALPELDHLAREAPAAVDVRRLLASALTCRGKYERAIAEYGTALRVDPTVDAAVLADLARLAQASSRGVRTAALALAAEVGVADRIDRTRGLALDLEQARTCGERRQAIARLRAVGTPAALTALRTAAGRRTYTLGIFVSGHKHGCVLKELREAIADVRSRIRP